MDKYEIYIDTTKNLEIIFVVFSINSISQTHINAYNLILEEDFRFCKEGKK